MKNISQFKTTMVQSAFVAAAFLGASSCTESQKQQKPEDTKEVAEERNEAKFNTAKSEKDAQFLVNAAEISLQEIKLGQLAQLNSTKADVKEMGKMMENAHTKSLADLKALAMKKSITIPTAPTDDAEEAYKKLSPDKGTKFDKEYSDMMVKGHKDAIETFEKASTDATDADIKQWAAAALPTLRTHLDYAMICQKKYDKMK